MLEEPNKTNRNNPIESPEEIVKSLIIFYRCFLDSYKEHLEKSISNRNSIDIGTEAYLALLDLEAIRSGKRALTPGFDGITQLLELFMKYERVHLLLCELIKRHGLHDLEFTGAALTYIRDEERNESFRYVRSFLRPWLYILDIPEELDEKTDTWKEYSQVAQIGILQGLEWWKNKKEEELIRRGLEGTLRYSIDKPAEYDVVDLFNKRITISNKEESSIRLKREDNGTVEEEDYFDLIPSPEKGIEETLLSKEELKERMMQAHLSPRQKLVIKLTLEDKPDEVIAVALKEQFGNEVTPEDVRYLRSAAYKKLRKTDY